MCHHLGSSCNYSNDLILSQEGPWFLVPPTAEDQTRSRIIVPGCPGLCPTMFQHVLQTSRHWLRQELHRRVLHHLFSCHALHLPHVSHRRQAFSISRTPHNLLRSLLQLCFAHILHRVPVGEQCCLRHSSSTFWRGYCGAGLSEQRLHPAFYASVLLLYCWNRVVGHTHHHLVPGSRTQVELRGHREESGTIFLFIYFF